MNGVCCGAARFGQSWEWFWRCFSACGLLRYTHFPQVIGTSMPGVNIAQIHLSHLMIVVIEHEKRRLIYATLFKIHCSYRIRGIQTLYQANKP